MRKKDELMNPVSCMSKALPEELTFVLLGRDEDAPEVIRYWCFRRISRGKNRPDDPQIQEALYCANQMELELIGLRESMRPPAPSR